MQFHTLTVKDTFEALKVTPQMGLTKQTALENRAKYGENSLTKAKKRGFFARVFSFILSPKICFHYKIHWLIFWLVLQYDYQNIIKRKYLWKS